MKKILVLNGPNLNLLATREPAQYGSTTLPDVEAMYRRAGERLGHEVECFQSNWEGALIARESFRHHSLISPAAAGIVVGFGVPGYVVAIDGLARTQDPDNPALR